jgi:hypothetical protein
MIERSPDSGIKYKYKDPETGPLQGCDSKNKTQSDKAAIWWTEDFTKTALATSDYRSRLLAAAIAAGVITDCDSDRAAMLAWASYCLRVKSRSPGGLFLSGLHKKDKHGKSWRVKCATTRDEAQAQAWRADRDAALPRVSDLGATVITPAEADAAAQAVGRDEQLRRLAALQRSLGGGV